MILRYGLLKRFKRGIQVNISLLYSCNLDCEYCVNKISGKRPDVKPVSVKQWKDWFNEFPYRISEVLISGGSPELYPGFEELVTWLLSSGYFVQVYTNLTMPDVLERLPKSYRLILISTFHHSFSQLKYTSNYLRLKRKYRIVVDEIIGNYNGVEYKKLLHYSKGKEFTDTDGLKTVTMLRVAPDQKIYLTCYDLYV